MSNLQALCCAWEHVGFIGGWVQFQGTKGWPQIWCLSTIAVLC